MQNNTKLFFSFNFALVLVSAAVFAFFYSPESGAQGDRAPLFNLAETPRAKAENEKYSLASVRESEIVFQNNAFEGGNSSRLIIPLFDEKTYEAVRLESEGFEAR